MAGLSMDVGVGSILALLSVVHALDTSADVYILCNTQTFPTASDALTRLLHSLEQKASSSPYATSTADSLLAAFQCRGDLPPSSCSQSCVHTAVQTALSSCPNAIGSRVQLDGCFLRYENYSFFTPDSSVVVELCNTQPDNTSSFQTQVTQLLSRVTSAAPKNKVLYASASAALASPPAANGSSTHLYALAQCLDYLSAEECSKCLAAHASSWQDCDHAVGAQIHSVSCYYRYEIYPFYYLH